MSSLSSSSPEKRKQLGNPSDLKLQAWVQAIVNGADERSPRWRHAMLLAGLLVGLGADEFADEMSLSLQSELARGLVRSVNLALESERQVDVLPGACLALVLAQCWTDVPERERRGLDYDVSGVQWKMWWHEGILMVLIAVVTCALRSCPVLCRGL